MCFFQTWGGLELCACIGKNKEIKHVVLNLIVFGSL